jgi:hypothetical protein
MADNIDFTIISTGHYAGNYKNIDSVKVAIEQLSKEKEHGNVIKLNVGNNMTEYQIKNELFTTFMNKTGFNFNFLGRTEYLWREKIDFNKLRPSTLNIFSRDILPYQLMKMDDYMVAVAGITDIYQEDIKGKIPYKRELTNLMYMLEDNIDFFFLVTDLEREENVEILKDFPHVNAIFESRENLYDFGIEKIEYAEEIGNSYIIPNHGISIIDFEYDSTKDEYSTDQIGFRLKKARLKSRENVLNPQRFGYDRDLTSYISWADEKVKNENSLIIGNNENSFNPYEIHLNSEVAFLDDLADKLMKDFDQDVVIYPKSSLIKGIKKGLYTRLEIQDMFSTEKFITFKLTREELSQLISRGEEKRGTEEYFYLTGLNKNPLREEYKIISFENILANYGDIIGKDYNVEKIGVKEYLINK